MFSTFTILAVNAKQVWFSDAILVVMLQEKSILRLCVSLPDYSK